MKNLFLLPLLFILALLATPAFADSGDGPLFSNSAIRGTVTSADGTPLANIRVSLVDPFDVDMYSSIPHGSATTDENGRYEMSAVPPGTYLMRLRDRGASGEYATTFYPNTLTPGDAKRLVLLNSDTLEVNATLFFAGQIAGTVNIEGDQLLDSYSVTAHRHVNGIGWLPFETFRPSRQNGPISMSFALSGLPPGPYRLEFQGRVYTNGEQIYHQAWYLGAESVEAATDIQVERAVSTSVTWQIEDRSAQLSGRVVSAENTPLSSINVSVYKFNPDSLPGEEWSYSVAYERTNNAGVYSVTLDEPGHYKVEFSSYNKYTTVYNGGALTLGAAPVIIVDGEDISGIDATMSKGGQVEGRVMTEHGQAQLRYVNASISRWNGYDAYLNYWEHNTNSSADGGFRITDLQPGRYRIILNGSFLNGVDFTHQLGGEGADVVVENNKTTQLGDVTMLGFGSSINGQITDAAGKGYSGIRIFVYTEGEPYNSAFVRVNSNGYYSIKPLPAGDYRVRVFDENNNSGATLVDSSVIPREDTRFGTVLVADGEQAQHNVVMEVGAVVNGRIRSQWPAGYMSVSLLRQLEDGTWQTAIGDSISNSGWFSFDGLPDGKYTVAFFVGAPCCNSNYYADGFLGPDGTMVTDLADAASFDVAAGSTVSGIDIFADQFETYRQQTEGPTGFGSFSGRVTDESGQPIAGVVVSLYREYAPPVRGGPYWTTWDKTVVTNANGEYTLSDIPIDEPWHTNDFRVGFNGALVGFGTEYYGDTVMFDSAEIVTLSLEQQNLIGINAALSNTGCVISTCSPQ